MRIFWDVVIASDWTWKENPIITGEFSGGYMFGYLLLNFEKLKLTRKKFDKNDGIVWSRADARNPIPRQGGSDRGTQRNFDLR